MNYQEWKRSRIRKLGKYKYEVLKIQENGICYNDDGTPILDKKSGEPLSLPSVLPVEINEQYKWQNIIPSEYKSDIIQTIIDKKIELHNDFHHLNSSQAFCFNLFFPILIEDEYKYIDNSEEITEKTYAFEHIINKKEKTCYDLFINNSKHGIKKGYEIKYTEFTPNERTETQKNKDAVKYSKDNYKIAFEKYRMPEIRKYFDKDIGMNEFYSYYQIYRYIINTYEKDMLMFYVFPKDRPQWREIVEIKMSELRKDFDRKKINFIIVDDFIHKITDKYKTNNKIQLHYALFQKKYLW
jgi:hypothetical protein